VNGTTLIKATFTETTRFRLNVTKAGTGTGTVASVPAGIDCGGDCSSNYRSGRVITLTATAAAGSRFTGWTGDTGCGSSFTMTSDKQCTANFQVVSDTPAPTSPNGAAGCPCTIWRGSATPALLVDSDTNPVELGVKFRADHDGYITGIRFYKTPANTGTHVGHLWTSTGRLLASVTFSGETSSGWQQANFSRPVPISADTTYVASYHTTVGRYSADVGYFSSGSVRNGPLRALSNWAGGNGVYRYGRSGGFPNQTYQSSNYWVDVVFMPR
jgi:hypothetical protein